jgi:DNA-binding CsgD family transcriptional regulator
VTADTAGVITRRGASRLAADFLATVPSQPSALVIEGEAGIGKTTCWLGVIQQARASGFRVLSARPSESEAVLAYASLADLFAEVDPAIWSELPPPQRQAIDVMLFRASSERPVDQRAVAAGFVAVIEELAKRAPVLLSIDDLPWLDPSSAAVLAFAIRRFSGRVGLLVTARLEAKGDPAAWVQPLRPAALQRVRLAPMTLGELHNVLSERLGRSFARPTLVRIHEVSGGNPFYAMELARAIGDTTLRATDPLPGTLSEAVQTRLSSLGANGHDVLLAAACSAEPSVELLAEALGVEADVVVTMLGDAEEAGIVSLERSHVRFSHPLLAHAVYAGAPTSRRREMHRRMAQAVDDLESRARHLALAAARGDSTTLDALDAAANLARTRGAPVAAAELLDLAIQLGGDTPERRIASARYHFDAGDPARAGILLDDTLKQLPHGVVRASAANLLAIVRLLTDNFLEAADLLEDTLADAAGNLTLTVQMLLTLSFALFNAGETTAAERHAERAVTEAERLEDPELLSQALSMQTILRFIVGDGYDDETMQRALSLEDRHAKVSTAFQPSAHHALLLMCTGELERAGDAWASVRQRCIDQGEYGELTFVLFHNGLLEIWRGNYQETAMIAAEMTELAQQLNGELPWLTANTLQGALAAYTGREDDARRAVRDAQIAAERANARRLADWPINVLGFLEVSLGNYDEALRTFTPLLPQVQAFPDLTEIIAASFVPDAVESFVQLGRLDEAEPFIEAFERNGTRLDRPWMHAVGGRCRAMLLAARGELDAAVHTAQHAMSEHDRLPMPFERARTQLLLGQIQRRQRGKEVAAATLREALALFEALGTPIWAARAREELDRVTVGRQLTGELSVSERRVAELAATGMTNREVAAALFVSPKTVESNLARVYRKLGIRTRAELGQRIADRRV